MFIAIMGKDRKKTATRLYNIAVAQARLPVFYKTLQVPDSVDGRFDLLSLHVFMIVARLNRAGRAGSKLAQSLFDLMFIDMDRSVRELGVGDLGVPKHMRRMMKGFNGRCIAYADALRSPVQGDLREALRRNVYGTLAGQTGNKVRLEPVLLATLETYVRDAAAHLASLADDKVLKGEIDFPVEFYDEHADQYDNGMVA
jgi:cytochrome b pre-mRNA-processing protein 3